MYQRRDARARYANYTTWSGELVHESSRPDARWARHVW